MADGETFNVLFVCTANVCRSAFAELLCRQLLVDRLGPGAERRFAISSAGVNAVIGASMHRDTRAALALWGWPLFEEAEAFVARPLRPHMLHWADLILTAEEAHRSKIAWETPKVTDRLFTLLRFARIGRGLNPQELPTDPVLRARALVLHAARSTEPARGSDSVPDPIGQSYQHHLRMGDRLFDAVGALVDGIAPLRVES